jgi:outer membrane protein OmpA-like peptidoglycan-associated protein
MLRCSDVLGRVHSDCLGCGLGAVLALPNRGSLNSPRMPLTRRFSPRYFWEYYNHHSVIHGEDIMMRNLLYAAASTLLLCGLAEASAAAADADLKITVTNGDDTAGDVKVQVRPAGQHSGDVIADGGSGDDITVPAGTYDVDVIYNDGAANKTIWFDGLVLSGRIEKTVDMGMPVAALQIMITNGGSDVADGGIFEVRPPGNHSADVIASEGSGGTVRVAVGTYDVDVRFRDGTLEKFIWLDGLVLSGAVRKTVEVGAAIADITWHITNHGRDVADDGKYQIRPDGNHNGDVIASGDSGQEVRLAAGDYDIDIIYAKDLINKTIWLDHQSLTGKIDRTTELNLDPAQATVSATLNGTDEGEKARIGITPAGQHDEIGDARGGQTVLLEAGHYQLTATMPGAEGALPDAAITGHAHLTVVMNALHTAELKPGSPPPKECTIEVYGVNFDFNKSTLRADSEPTLRSVLQLFAATPWFRAEVGGHTDNVGTPDYNMRLSDARAAAVKAWLVAHSIAADRVTSRGYGDTRPLVPNDTDANRFKNRRVELRRMNCQ